MKYLWGPLMATLVVLLAVLQIAPWRLSGMSAVHPWLLTLALCVLGTQHWAQEAVICLMHRHQVLRDKVWVGRLRSQKLRSGLFGQRTMRLIEQQRRMIAAVLATDEETVEEMGRLSQYGKYLADVWLHASAENKPGVQQTLIWKRAQAAVSARKQARLLEKLNA